jgi:hypothetical protein
MLRYVMKLHACERCGYQTRRKSDLHRHLSSVFPCVPVDADHQTPREVLLDRLGKTMRGYARMLPAGSVVNINITDNSQHVHIHVNDFGQENIAHFRIAGGDDRRLLGSLPDIRAMLRSIHYDPEHPENHNLCVTNVKDDVAYVVKDSEFQPASARNCAERFLLTAKRLMDVYLSWNEEDVQLHEEAEAEWREFIRLMNDAFQPERAFSPRDGKDIGRKVRDKIDDVLHVMRFESMKRWPRGHRSLSG